MTLYKITYGLKFPRGAWTFNNQHHVMSGSDAIQTASKFAAHVKKTDFVDDAASSKKKGATVRPSGVRIISVETVISDVMVI